MLAAAPEELISVLCSEVLKLSFIRQLKTDRLIWFGAISHLDRHSVFGFHFFEHLSESAGDTNSARQPCVRLPRRVRSQKGSSFGRSESGQKRALPDPGSSIEIAEHTLSCGGSDQGETGEWRVVGKIYICQCCLFTAGAGNPARDG